MMMLLTLQEENSGLRHRLGSGKVGLNILLGGTLQDEELGTTFGGAGSISATARLAAAHKDVRLKQIASGTSAGADSGGGVGGGGYQPERPPLTQAK